MRRRSTNSTLRGGLRLVLGLAMLIASCSAQRGPADLPYALPPANGSPAPVVRKIVGKIYRETGLASWYGEESRGRITASGEPFDMYAMTAAHRTLPLGSIVRVTNLDNYKSVTVKINDRGPFVASRIIELSYGAAKKLGFVAQGTATVKIETLEPANLDATYTVQAAVFTEKENAEALKDRLSRKFSAVSIVPFKTSLGTLYRVHVGSYGSEEKAELVASRLRQEGLEPMVVMQD